MPVEFVRVWILGFIVHEVPAGHAGDLTDVEVWTTVGEGERFDRFPADGH